MNEVAGAQHPATAVPCLSQSRVREKGTRNTEENPKPTTYSEFSIRRIHEPCLGSSSSEGLEMQLRRAVPIRRDSWPEARLGLRLDGLQAGLARAVLICRRTEQVSR